MERAESGDEESSPPREMPPLAPPTGTAVSAGTIGGGEGPGCDGDGGKASAVDTTTSGAVTLRMIAPSRTDALAGEDEATAERILTILVVSLTDSAKMVATTRTDAASTARETLPGAISSVDARAAWNGT